MNIDFDEYLIPIIVVGCLCVGFVLKKWMPKDDKWIPTILFFLGCISGAIVLGFSYEGIVKGAISGLASVGLHQVFYQHIKAKHEDDLTTEVYNQDLLIDMLGFDENMNLLGELESEEEVEETEESEE